MIDEQKLRCGMSNPTFGPGTACSVPAKPYFAAGYTFFYPGAGDPAPPGGAKVLLLTIGGVCTMGSWNNSGAFLGWAPLPKRDKTKEAML